MTTGSTLLQSLAELQIEGEESIVIKVIQAYLEGSGQVIVKISEAYASRDLNKLGQLAHGLKSSSGNVGAITLSEKSRDLEMLCKDESLHIDGHLIASIESEFAIVQQELRKEIYLLTS